MADSDLVMYKAYLSLLINSRLPYNFNKWGVTNINGWTLAHTAAYKNLLPKNFTQWDIKDDKGTSVAHIAAIHGTLPLDFDRWDIEDRVGVTVKQMLEYFKNNYPKH